MLCLPKHSLYEFDRVFKQPDPATTIWRYMDFTKLVALWSKKELHFTRADQFPDHFEGSVPIANVKSFYQKWDELMSVHPEYRDVVGDGWRPPTCGEYLRESRETLAVNCWHINEHESEAMWKLYHEGGKGIAIRSTIGRLLDCFDDDPTRLILVGKVTYIDFKSESIPLEHEELPICYKRMCYEHERELRAVAVGCEEDPRSGRVDITTEIFDECGVDVGINVEKLTERVFVSPASPEWVEDLVRSVADRYELNVEVERSDLKNDPVW